MKIVVVGALDKKCSQVGFLRDTMHNIQEDAPPQNILAMADAAGKFGQY